MQNDTQNISISLAEYKALLIAALKIGMVEKAVANTQSYRISEVLSTILAVDPTPEN